MAYEELDSYEKAGADRAVDLLAQNKRLQTENKKLRSENIKKNCEFRKHEETYQYLRKHEKQLRDACIEAKSILETDPRYPGFAEDCDCGRCTMCKIRNAIGPLE